jgi:quercetin dioxygenase-like cupin family protein
MRAGDVVKIGRETFKILRSAADGGCCEMEVEVAPGSTGPPPHVHEHVEENEVIEGSVVYWLDGVEKHVHAGDKVVIPPGVVHAFKNPSKTAPVRAIGTTGGRFERLIDQMAAGEPRFLRMALYSTTVDPRASHLASPLARAFLRAAALAAKLMGVKLAPPTGPYGVDGAPTRRPTV